HHGRVAPASVRPSRRDTEAMKPRLHSPIGTHLHPIVFDDLGEGYRPVAGTWRPGTGGDAIVFLHGLGCSRAMWETIIDTADTIPYKAQPYSLYAIDFPCHGDTPPARQLRGLDSAMAHLTGSSPRSRPKRSTSSPTQLPPPSARPPSTRDSCRGGS